MTEPLDKEADDLAWGRSPEPGWIDSAGGPLFCWYHAPRGTARARAVLLCEALGHDRMNLHLSYRHLALRLSHAGYATLRFDYAGTGDSSGSPRDPDWAKNWTTGLEAAAQTLLARSNTGSLALFGARFGGTLAARFAASRTDVDALLLWGPYLRGRAFLRNESALDKIIYANPLARKPSEAVSGDREFVGFLYDESTRAELEGIELAGIQQNSLRHARIFAWDSDSPEDELASHWSENGIDVEFSRDTEFSSETSLTQQAVPEPLLAQTIQWLDQLGDESSPVLRHSTGIETSLPTRAHVHRSARRPEPIAEEVLSFGEDSGLFGILTRAVSEKEAAQRPALILVSGGNNHRSGINRNYTEWARDAALHGTTALRFDIRGLGDSPPLRVKDLNRLYLHETGNDLREAIDLIEAHVTQKGIILCGLCAGAYQALHSALDDPRVTGVILLDLLRWDRDSSKTRRPGFADRRRRDLERLSRRFRSFFSGADAVPEPSLLAGHLTQLVDRGVDVVAVGCLSRGGHERFVEAIGPHLPRLQSNEHFRLEALENTDHIFSPLWAQEWLANLLSQTLDSSAPLATGGRADASHELDQEQKSVEPGK